MVAFYAYLDIFGDSFGPPPTVFRQTLHPCLRPHPPPAWPLLFQHVYSEGVHSPVGAAPLLRPPLHPVAGILQHAGGIELSQSVLEVQLTSATFPAPSSKALGKHATRVRVGRVLSTTSPNHCSRHVPSTRLRGEDSGSSAYSDPRSFNFDRHSFPANGLRLRYPAPGSHLYKPCIPLLYPADRPSRVTCTQCGAALLSSISAMNSPVKRNQRTRMRT
ncbi:hypothetical protein C8Q78DRAFT_449127 [Trametes maxima]|nr:hypothetical protein C8Q78DRAFT_449127 [Trametes maxima]